MPASPKALRKAIATRGSLPVFVHTDEAFASARRAEYGPPTDGELFDIATAYCSAARTLRRMWRSRQIYTCDQ